jgi:hypothetical protein
MRRLAFQGASPGRPWPAGSAAPALGRWRLRFGRRRARVGPIITGLVVSTAGVWDGWSVTWIAEVATPEGVVSVVGPPHLGRQLGAARPGDPIVIHLAGRGALLIARRVVIGRLAEPGGGG